MSRYPLTPSPRALRHARFDNLALVPGNLLPFMQQSQEIANRLPSNAVLIVLPSNSPAQKETMLVVARLLAAKGRLVRVISKREWACQTRRGHL
jgi:hypothetical protein